MTNQPKTLTRRALLKQAAAISLASLLPLSALMPEAALVAEVEPEAPKRRTIGKDVRIFFDTQEISGEPDGPTLDIVIDGSSDGLSWHEMSLKPVEITLNWDEAVYLVLDAEL